MTATHGKRSASFRVHTRFDNWRLGGIEFAVGQRTSALFSSTAGSRVHVSTGLRSPVYGIGNLTCTTTVTKKKHATHTLHWSKASGSYALYNMWSPRAGTSATSTTGSYVAFTWLAFEE